MHELAAGQDTQKSWPVGITGFGVGVTDQPGAEAPAGTEARAGETGGSPPSMPSIAPSATVPPSPALAGSAPRRRWPPCGTPLVLEYRPGTSQRPQMRSHAALRTVTMRISSPLRGGYSQPQRLAA